MRHHDELYVLCWRGQSGTPFHSEPFASEPGGYAAALALADALNAMHPGVDHWVEPWRG